MDADSTGAGKSVTGSAMAKGKPEFAVYTLQCDPDDWRAFKALSALRDTSVLQGLQDLIHREVENAAKTGELVVRSRTPKK